MKVSEIMVTDVAKLTAEDTVAKALALMVDRSIHQVPVVDESGAYSGMIFAKQFLASSAQPASKLKSFVTSTTSLSPDQEVEDAAKTILGTGSRALPVVQDGKLAGMLSETDIAQTADFGHAIVDEVMTGAIVIEEDTPLADAVSKMRRYNISRLPVISKAGVIRGILSILDAAGIMAAPTERTSKSAAISGGRSKVKGEVKVKDIMRRAISVERGTKLNELSDYFKKNEELVVVGDGRPIGVVTPKDALELVLPKKGEIAIHIAHMGDEDDRRDIEDHLTKFVKKIQGQIRDLQNVVVYADKHRTRKYSVRCRLITGKGVINAHAVGFDPISAVKELIRKLDRQVKAEHTQKVKQRKKQRGTPRRG
ncbi:MAG: CBS domain-containing protein [Nitrososphaera sp.]|uniref:CBS domain-containing protein n=2 Tax=Nitrososphaera sp. TaxID=1971748 RepID=UPI0018576099|nr:CBS domain-containing protein [Nitrososphaera sp.]NWG36744.1 CBS domain-containing protein [Nitrososphaera sp.]